MNEHTELPWKVEIRQDNICILSGNKAVALMCVKPDDDHLYKPIVVEANAELIFRGCNNHKILLDACERARNVMRQPVMINVLPDTFSAWITVVLAELNAAITKANEEI